MSFTTKVVTSASGSTDTFSYAGITLFEDAQVAESAQIAVYLDGVLQDASNLSFNAVADTVQILSGNPTAGTIVTCQRETKDDARYVTFTDNATIDEDDLNRNGDQLLYLIQEALTGIDDSMQKDVSGTFWQAEGLEVRNAVAGTTSNSLVTLSQMQAAVAGVTVVEIDNVTSWYFDGDASTTDFTLTDAPSSLTNESQLFVYVSGVAQRHDTDSTTYDFDLNTSGSEPVVEFAVAPPTGTANVFIRVVTGETVGSTVADGSIVGSSIADGTITGDKMFVEPRGTGYFARVNANGGLVGAYVTPDNIDDPTGAASGVLTSWLVANVPLNSFNGNMTGAMNFNNVQLGNVGTATLGTSAVNKAQMDAADNALQSQITANAASIAGLSFSQSASGSESSGSGTTSVNLGFQPDIIILYAAGDLEINLGGTQVVVTGTLDADASITATGFNVTGGGGTHDAFNYLAIKH